MTAADMPTAPTPPLDFIEASTRSVWAWRSREDEGSRMATRAPRRQQSEKVVSAMVGPDLLRAIRDDAAGQDRTVSNLVRRILANHYETAANGSHAEDGGGS